MASSTMSLKILTPERVFSESTAGEVRVPGVQGELGVRPGHANLLTPLQAGLVSISGGKEAMVFYTSGGLLQVKAGAMTLLLEVIECAEDIDLERAKDAAVRAQKRLKEQTIAERKIDVGRALGALNRARAREKLIRISKSK